RRWPLIWSHVSAPLIFSCVATKGFGSTVPEGLSPGKPSSPGGGSLALPLDASEDGFCPELSAGESAVASVAEPDEAGSLSALRAPAVPSVGREPSASAPSYSGSASITGGCSGYSFRLAAPFSPTLEWLKPSR